MAAAVDVRSMLVVNGGAERAFTADCAAGSATLEGGRGPVAIRVLRWEEKCALARFAASGAEFLSRQMITACAGPGIAEAEQPFVLGLAVWLHGPEGSPLPFDQRVLAGVTLALCRALGQSVAALGSRPAPEVEALWLALGQQMPAVEAVPQTGDVHRIVVLADAAPASIAMPEPASAAKDAPAPREVGPADAPVAAPARTERFRVRFSPGSASTPTGVARGKAAPAGLPPIAAAMPALSPSAAANVPSPAYPSAADAMAQAVTGSPVAASSVPVASASTALEAPLAAAMASPASSTVLRTPNAPSLPRPVIADPASARPDFGHPPQAEVSAALDRVIAAASRRPPPAIGSGLEQDGGTLAERLADEAGALGIALVA